MGGIAELVTGSETEFADILNNSDVAVELLNIYFEAEDAKGMRVRRYHDRMEFVAENNLKGYIVIPGNYHPETDDRIDRIISQCRVEGKRIVNEFTHTFNQSHTCRSVRIDGLAWEAAV